MRSWLQIITTPTSDTLGTTVLLCTDTKRYLVGSLAEGLQRACTQTGARLLKVTECFVTGRTEWQNTGGIYGLILTLADGLAAKRFALLEENKRKVAREAARQGIEDQKKVREMLQKLNQTTPVQNLDVFSPPNLTYALAVARRYIFRTSLPVKVHEIDEHAYSLGPDKFGITQPYWQDNSIKVWPMSIFPADNKPSNPRKRSFEMLDTKNTVQQSKPAALSEDMPEDEHYKLVITKVVDDMFNSSWRLDTLHEMRLADVQMPATIFIRNAQTGKVEKYTGIMPGGEEALPDPDLEVLVRTPWPGVLKTSLPPAKPAKEAISYIFRNIDVRGKFLVEKAKALKVQPGRAYAELAAGKDVQNSDGEIVTSAQVLGPSRIGASYAVIELPDDTYIENLIDRPEWKDPYVAGDVKTIIWSCGKNVATNQRLKDFIASMPDTRHIISSAELCSNYLAYPSSAESTIRLQQIDSKRYTLPFHNNTSSSMEGFSSNVTLARPGQTIELQSTSPMKLNDGMQPLDVKAVIDDLPSDILDAVEDAKEKIHQAKDELQAWAQQVPGKNVEITTLGTGSSLPSKYRNVSATLLRVPGWGSVLFDCGENTLGQLKRAYPPDEVKQIIQNLKVIVISHMHADHHLGTVSVIKAWYEEVHASQPAAAVKADVDINTIFDDTQRLAVLADRDMLRSLYEYSAIEDYGFSRLAPLRLLTARGKEYGSTLRWFDPSRTTQDRDLEQALQPDTNEFVAPATLGLADVQAVPVNHCSNARAVSITWPDGFKASYSGDCRPSEDFVRIGQGSTVCIHEATFDDDMQDHAEAKRHSTTSEALQVAQAMGAKTCVLTHFSQRYQKFPVLETAVGEQVQPLPDDVGEHTYTPFEPEEGAGEGSDSYRGSESAAQVFRLNSDMKVCVAFDYMRVKVGDIAEMQYYTPAMIKLLEHSEKDEFDHLVEE